MELKEKTKNKKQKKTNGRKQFFAGIGVGLLFSAITLILLGMFASCSAKDNTALPIDDQHTIYNNNQIQRALTPPSQYDLELSAITDEPFSEDTFYWQDYNSLTNTEAIFDLTYGQFDTYTNSNYFNGLNIITQVIEPTTNMEFRDVNAEQWVFKGQYFGSAASSPAFSRFRITLDNRNSNNAFLFYSDFYSSGYSVYAEPDLYDVDNAFVARLNTYMYYYDAPLRALYVPSHSRITFSTSSTTSQQYLNALYIKNLGNFTYDVGYDDGESVGYDDGYDDGWVGGYGQGYYVGYDDGNNFGYDMGYDTGYANGLQDFAEGGVFPPLTMSFNLINSALGGVLDIFTIDVMPGVSLLSLMLVPLTIALVVMVFRFLRG